MTIYKASCVVIGGKHPGAIVNLERRLQEGERIKLGKNEFRVMEVVELLPGRGDFRYLHVTCKPIGENG